MNREAHWEKFYESTEYDLIPWLRVPFKSLNKAIEKIHISGTALDAGCGTGEKSIHLASLGFLVDGVDISKRAIEIAKKQNRYPDTCKFHSGDIFKFKTNKTYDLILDIGNFHALLPTEYTKYANLVKSLLKRSGYFVLYCHTDRAPESEIKRRSDVKNIQPRYFSPEKIASVFKDFRIIDRQKADFKMDKGEKKGRRFLDFYLMELKS